MQSPIKAIRLERNIDVKRFAACAGISAGHLSEVENGLAEIDEKLRSFLADELGEDAAKVLAKHRRFMTSKKREWMKKVTASAPQ